MNLLLQYQSQAIDTKCTSWQNSVNDSVNEIYRNYNHIIDQLRQSVPEGRKVTEREILGIALPVKSAEALGNWL